jgi:hypothetical protein
MLREKRAQERTMDAGGGQETGRLYSGAWLWELEDATKECRYVHDISYKLFMSFLYCFRYLC